MAGCLCVIHSACSVHHVRHAPPQQACLSLCLHESPVEISEKATNARKSLCSCLVVFVWLCAAALRKSHTCFCFVFHHSYEKCVGLSPRPLCYFFSPWSQFHWCEVLHFGPEPQVIRHGHGIQLLFSSHTFENCFLRNGSPEIKVTNIWH